jgi:putative ABC transport system substrate-binding protein
MYRRTFMVLVGTAAGRPLVARAQQKGVLVIGWLSPLHSDQPLPQRDVVAFRQGLAEAGFVEGQNVRLEYRWAEGDAGRLPALAADLVARKVDLIATQGGDIAAVAAKNATATIPIVFNSFDPVAAGLIVSLARPGGNLTGVAMMVPELMPKLLEVLLELVPRAGTAALLENPQSDVAEHIVPLMRKAARAKEVRLQVLNATAIGDFDAVFAELDRRHAEGLIVGLAFGRHLVAPMALRHRLPAIAMARFSGQWRPRQLRAEPCRYVSPEGRLCRPDSQRRKAGRPASAATDDLRAGDQPEDCEGARPNCGAIPARPRRRGHRMRRRPLALIVVLAALTITFLMAAADAQQPGRVYRLGWLTPQTVTGAPEREFLEAMREHGYIEGENLVIEVHDAKGQFDRFAPLAGELVALKPDCIVAIGVGATEAAKRATTTIPIVMGNADDDPVRRGLIANFAHPGGNVTGVTNIGADLAGKRLELLRELMPGLSHAAILLTDDSPLTTSYLRNTDAAADVIGIKIERLRVRRAEELDDAFRKAADSGAQAVIVPAVGLANVYQRRIVDVAIFARLPLMTNNKPFAAAGALISYDGNRRERERQVAGYVSRILKGAKPADLPVEQPTKFEFVINLKTAKALSLTMPQSLLARADEVIE